MLIDVLAVMVEALNLGLEPGFEALVVNDLSHPAQMLGTELIVNAASESVSIVIVVPDFHDLSVVDAVSGGHQNPHLDLHEHKLGGQLQISLSVRGCIGLHLLSLSLEVTTSGQGSCRQCFQVSTLHLFLCLSFFFLETRFLRRVSRSYFFVLPVVL